MSEPERLAGRTFTGRTLQGSRFVGCDLSGVVVRGSEVAGMELDSPWLLEGGNRLLVNGVDVAALRAADRFTVLDADAVLHAVTKYQTSNVVNAPSLTLRSGQRGNVKHPCRSVWPAAG